MNPKTVRMTLLVMFWLLFSIGLVLLWVRTRQKGTIVNETFVDKNNLINVEDIDAVSTLKDTRILMELQDIEAPDKMPPYDVEDIVVKPNKKLPEDVIRTGNQLWVYFVPKRYKKDCDEGKFRRPDFWYNLPQNSLARQSLALKDVINTNCKYHVEGWNHSWKGNQKEYNIFKETRDIRGNPLDWLRVMQAATGPVRNQTGIIENVKTINLDGSDYYEASVNSIRGPEIWSKLCKDVTPGGVVLPPGLFLVLLEHPLRGYQLYINNAVTDLTRSNMWPFVNMFTERKATRGAEENLFMDPIIKTLNAFIYMKQLCGDAFLHTQVAVNFQFTKRIDVKTTSDADTKGTRNEMEARIRAYQTNISNLDRNVLTLSQRRDNELNNINLIHRQRISDNNRQLDIEKYHIRTRFDNPGFKKRYERRVPSISIRNRRNRRERFANRRKPALKIKAPPKPNLKAVFKSIGRAVKSAASKVVRNTVGRVFRPSFRTVFNRNAWTRDLNRELAVAERNFRYRAAEIDRWRTRSFVATSGSYTRMITNQNNKRTSHENAIKSINNELNKIECAMVDQIKELLSSLAFTITSRSSSPLYKKLEDLYSAETMDATGKPVSRIYIKIT